MILWGWKNARDEAPFDADPVGRAGPALPPRPGPDQGRRQRPSRTPRGPRPPSSTPATRKTAPSGRGSCPTAWRRSRPIYDRLGVKFDVQLGESFYDPSSPRSWPTCEQKGLAVESEGAIVVFVEQTEAPFMIRKRDGAFTYATTDLATIKYRVETWHPDQILYVVDHRQGDHFKQLFEVARKWGYHVGRPRARRLRHDPGERSPPVQDPRRRRRRPRVAARRGDRRWRARSSTKTAPSSISPSAQRVAEVVGLGAIKYADLSQNRISDYVFDWQKMMAMNGNTATYLQYAYARIQSIFRKGGFAPEAIRRERPPIELTHPAERALGVRLLRLPEVLELADSEHKPNILTDYLFDLANAFSTFLRGVPGLEGRVDRAPRQPARPLRSDRRDLEVWTEPSGNRYRGTDVSGMRAGHLSIAVAAC